jgi:hypothetical protein
VEADDTQRLAERKRRIDDRLDGARQWESARVPNQERNHRNCGRFESTEPGTKPPQLRPIRARRQGPTTDREAAEGQGTVSDQSLSIRRLAQRGDAAWARRIWGMYSQRQYQRLGSPSTIPNQERNHRNCERSVPGVGNASRSDLAGMRMDL